MLPAASIEYETLAKERGFASGASIANIVAPPGDLCYAPRGVIRPDGCLPNASVTTTTRAMRRTVRSCGEGF